MTDDHAYDWRIDAYASWLLALEELHRAAVAAGIIPPRDPASDQAWLEAMKADADQQP